MIRLIRLVIDGTRGTPQTGAKYDWIFINTLRMTINLPNDPPSALLRAGAGAKQPSARGVVGSASYEWTARDAY